MSTAEATTTRDRGARRRPFHAPNGPRVDDGLFGPGSAVWKVWTSASMYAAAYRSVICQMLLPPVGTGVDLYSDYSRDPFGRLRRTGHYFAAIALGDTPTMELVARQVRALHGRVEGIEPISGQPFRALDHELLLYVHVTGWHSALVCYERFNGPLTSTERAEYLRDGAVGTEHAGLPAELVPTTPDAIRAYYATIRPRLAYGAHADNVIRWFKRPEFAPRHRAFAVPVQLMKHAVITTLPRHVQRLTGMEHSEATAAAATVGYRAGVALLDDERLGAFQRTLVPEAYDLVQSARARQREWERQESRELPSRLARTIDTARRIVAPPR